MLHSAVVYQLVLRDVFPLDQQHEELPLNVLVLVLPLITTGIGLDDSRGDSHGDASEARVNQVEEDKDNVDFIKGSCPDGSHATSSFATHSSSSTTSSQSLGISSSSRPVSQGGAERARLRAASFWLSRSVKGHAV